MHQRESTCWVQFLAIENDGWDELSKHPLSPAAAPPPQSNNPDEDFDDNVSQIQPDDFGIGWPHGSDHDLETLPGPQDFRLSPQHETGHFNSIISHQLTQHHRQHQ